MISLHRQPSPEDILVSPAGAPVVSIRHGAGLNRKIRFALSLAAGLAVLAAVGWACDLEVALHAASGVSPLWLVPLSAVYSASWLFRGLRFWKILAMQGLRKGFLDALSLELVSDLANQFVPARLGDAVKVVYLKRRDGFGLAEGVFSAVLVRVLDLAALLSLSGLCLLMLPAGSTGAGHMAAVSGAASLAVISMAALVFWLRPSLLAGLLGGPLRRLREPVLRVRNGIKGTGMAFPGLFMISCSIWVFDVMTLLIFLEALGVSLSPFETAFVLFAANLAKAVPFSPNGLGVYEGAAVLLLTSFGTPRATAFAVSVLDHAFMNLFSAALSMAALARLGLSAGDLTGLASASSREPETGGPPRERP